MSLYKCKLVVGYEDYNGYDREAIWEATIEASDASKFVFSHTNNVKSTWVQTFNG